MVRRRALIVGIDDYPTGRLRGCVADARAIAEVLGSNGDGSPNFADQLLTSDVEHVTRARLGDAVENLFCHDDADMVLLYFAGHGVEAGLDGYLVTPDAARPADALPLRFVLEHANRSAAREVIIVLDCCHSGAFGRAESFTGQHQLREGLAVLTASRPGQTADETGGRGVFTSLVVAALQGGAADVLGQVTAASIYAYVDEALGPWDQRPLFRANLARLEPVRTVEPAVPLAELRRLGELFPAPDAVLPLDPSYEPTTEPHDAANEAAFGILQRCRAAKLVEPVGESHLYFAAVNSTGCRLTPLGARYWRRARERKL
jgi:hypothetical protein